LAREREDAYENALATMDVNGSSQLRDLRAYLGRLFDRKCIKEPVEKAVQLQQEKDGVNKLTCSSVKFVSESRLEFTIWMEPQPPGWRISEFEFNLILPRQRDITAVLVHLNAERGRDCLKVPRCHLQIGRAGKHGKAHIPFPVMSPLLMLHLICEVIEPDFAG
jgi:hypothetical protein